MGADPWADRTRKGRSLSLRMMHHTAQDAESFQNCEAGMGRNGGCGSYISSWRGE